MARSSNSSQSNIRLSQQDAINIALMSQNISDISKRLDSMDDLLKDDFVRKAEFDPVRNLVYGFIMLIVVAVVGALIGMVVIRPSLTTQIQTSAPQQK